MTFLWLRSKGWSRDVYALKYALSATVGKLAGGAGIKSETFRWTVFCPGSHLRRRTGSQRFGDKAVRIGTECAWRVSTYPLRTAC